MPRLLSLSLPLAGALLLTSAVVAAAQADLAADAREAAVIRQILDVTHAADQIITAIESSVPAQRRANPRIPAVFWDRLLAQARERRGDLLNAIVPVYVRSFELSELEGLLEFYKSSLGRRLVEIQPTLLTESMQAGQAWGARLGTEIGQQLATEGITLQP